MEISIIIPVYNAEKYLKECLDSVLAQTVKEKEIICIDDGSTDNSGSILQQYQDNYREIKVLYQENQGSGAARNEGLRVARGAYVCFLDADDYYLDSMALEKMIRTCKDRKAEICGSLLNIKAEWDQTEKREELYRLEWEGHPDGIELNYLEYQDDYHYTTYIFDMQMINDNNICFPLYRRYQDPPFLLKAMLTAGKIWILPVELYCHRLGHQNLRKHEEWISDILMGIRDNMEVSRKNCLYKLQDRLLSRINNDFYRHIVNRFDKDICMLLCDIQKDVMDQNQSIRQLEEVGGYFELKASHFIMSMLVESRYKVISLEVYLLNISVARIAIYGLGVFGSALYSELKDSRIHIVCGIDQGKKCFWGGIPVVSNITEADGYDAVIVTPLKEGDSIAKELKKSVTVPVYTLVEILTQIKQITEKE